MTLNSTPARILTVAGIGIGAVALIGGTATAASMVTADQMATGSVNSRVLQDHSVHQRDMSAHLGGLVRKGGLKGAYYSVAKYDVGDTNGGAIATVACEQPTDVAISGGVQTLGVDGSQADQHNNGLTDNVPVSNSFPGRMDWTTNTPKSDRLDGWVIQFGTQTGAAPKYVHLWALCVPGAKVPVKTTYTQSVDG